MLLSEMISHADLRRLFHYDPATGALTHTGANTRSWKARAGRRAGTAGSAQEHCCVKVGPHLIGTHRVIWYWVTGQEPPPEIDHINGVRNDNRWTNLREVDRTQNMMNRGLCRRNKTGYKGVSFDKRTGKFKAEICCRGVKHTLGRFDTAEEARDAYLAKSAELQGEFARDPKHYRNAALGVPIFAE